MGGTVLVWLGPVALAFSVAALVVALAAARPRRVPSGEIESAARAGDYAAALEQAAARIAALEASHARLRADLDRVAQTQRGTLQHAGLIRFDALNEQTGELSFAIALLDDDETGIVLSSINGRQQTRIYGKTLDGGKPSVPLSDEERQAIARAMRAR